jgi:hypothetical protein
MVIRDFKANLADKPYCSHDLSRLLIRSKEHAANYPYIQPNHAHKITYMVFDVDRGRESFFSYLKADLPEPNFICQSESGNAHLFYRLKNPIWTHSRAGTKAIRYFKALKTAITRKIGADEGYCGLISKNPLSSEWRTTELHDGQFELCDLDTFCLNLGQQDSYSPQEAANSITGRNCTLFDTLRLNAYKRVNEYRDSGVRFYDMWLKTLESEAQAINRTFSEPLPHSEVRAVVKSVAKWTWRNYDGTDQTNRGKLGFGETRHTNPELPMLEETEIKRRQSLAAELTHKHQKQNTELKIKQAIDRLNASGKKVTKAGVAKMTGLARENISRNYAHLFN